MSNALDLAKTLEAARSTRGLKLHQLAEQAGVSRQAIYRLFKGHDVQLSTLFAVLEVLQLDLHTLPRSLQRAMPEFEKQATPIAQTVTPTSHPPSAVQSRLEKLRNLERPSKVGSP